MTESKPYRKKENIVWGFALNLLQNYMYFYCSMKIFQLNLSARQRITGNVILFYFIFFFSYNISGPSCSKLTTSLVNDLLKFTSMIQKYAEIFCWKNVSSFCSAKATHIFSAKNIRIMYIESAKTVNEMTLNDVVKLTTLWTTGPWEILSVANVTWALRVDWIVQV